MATKKNWVNHLFELIRRASSTLPPDVEQALQRAAQTETSASARWAFNEILRNIRLARERSAPICQDTGTLNFLISIPHCFNASELLRAIPAAVRLATEKGLLRQNTIDSVTGSPCPDNLGPGAPSVHFELQPRKSVRIRLLMKGGGSENMSCQYSLPSSQLKAGRDLEGARRCILDAIWRAQGNGCAPGILGVCIGGDRASGAEHAKLQLFRRLGRASKDPKLASLERRVLQEANSLGIGPMGLGGKTTLLGVHVGSITRLPASFFVSIAYMCWACRRASFTIAPDGNAPRWEKYAD